MKHNFFFFLYFFMRRRTNEITDRRNKIKKSIFKSHKRVGMHYTDIFNLKKENNTNEILK